MGNVKIPYYVTRQRKGCPKWGYWSPCLARPDPKAKVMKPTLMAKLGFKLVDCGEDGPMAWAIAQQWNRRWLDARAAHLAGSGTAPEDRQYPPHSFGEAFARYRKTNSWLDGKKKRTKEDWWRGWGHIDPIFGDVDPRTVTFEDVDAWYGALLVTEGVREAHRAMKIWRALWVVMTAMEYIAKKDPSLGIRRKTPTPRNAVWFEGEAVRLVKTAWRMGYNGLAAALAVAWDTLLSPVDVRALSTSKMHEMGKFEPLFAIERTKSGRPAIGTISKRTARLLKAYIDGLPFTLLPDTPIFHTRGAAPGPKGGRPRPPVPYTKDQLGDDFRAVRAAIFPKDTRQVADFRRSGALEAEAGGADRSGLAKKMGNTIDTNAELQRTYLPVGQHSAAVVRMTDVARARGRDLLRGPRKGGNR